MSDLPVKGGGVATNKGPTPARNVTETESERLLRLARDAVGAGSLDAIRRSINLAAGLPADYGITDQGRLNDTQIVTSGDLNAIQARIRQIFVNRGVPIEVAAPTAPTAPAAPQTDSASATLRATLDSYGLGELADWAMGQLRDGRSVDWILLELRKQPAFQERFPGIAQRAAAGLPPISPAEYVAYERQAAQIFRQFGVPSGFYDKPEDFTRLIVSDVSPAELYERVQQGYQRVAYAPREVRDAFGRYFGARGDDALAAYFLDPTRAAPMLRNMVTEAEIGGAGQQQGFGVDLALARRLREFGVTQDAAREGFGQVRTLDSMFAETVDEDEDFTALREGVNAIFNLDPGSRRRLERRRQSRVAAFSGAGGAAAGQAGVVGAGVDEPTL